jgi:hypothetical protein
MEDRLRERETDLAQSRRQIASELAEAIAALPDCNNTSERAISKSRKGLISCVP